LEAFYRKLLDEFTDWILVYYIFVRILRSLTSVLKPKSTVGLRPFKTDRLTLYCHLF